MAGVSYYYVKSGFGTCVTDAPLAKQSGAFGAGSLTAGNVYANLENCILYAALAAGDTVLCSTAHAAVYEVFTVITVPNGVTVMSVMDTSANTYAAGATETVNNLGTTLDYIFDSDDAGSIAFLGMTFEAEDDILLSGAGGGIYLYFQDCTFSLLTAAADHNLRFNSADSHVVCKNITINHTHADQRIDWSASGSLYIDGLTGTGTLVNNLVDSGTGALSRVVIANSDLTTLLVATGGALLAATNASDARTELLIENCKMPTSYALTGATTSLYSHLVEVTGSGTADQYYQYDRQDRFNVVSTNLTTYLNATYDGVTGFSTKIDTHTDILPWRPYRYLLAVLPAQDLSTAKTVTVECSSDASLTDNDIWIEVVRQDGTDQALGVVVNSRASANVLATGTALTTAGTGTWTVGDTEDYIITKALGAIAAATNSNVEVWAVMGKASITAYFDMPTIAAT